MRHSVRSRAPINRYKPENHPYREPTSPKKSAKTRNRQGNKCKKCKIHITRYNSQIDHIKEIADGGGNERSNLQALCIPCHLKKTSSSKAVRSIRKKQSAQRTTPRSFENLDNLPIGSRIYTTALFNKETSFKEPCKGILENKCPNQNLWCCTWDNGTYSDDLNRDWFITEDEIVQKSKGLMLHYAKLM